MLLHYVYLGVPDEALIERVEKLLVTQENPDRVLDCGHPRAKLWTLDTWTQEKAQRLMSSSHPSVHIEIMASTQFLAQLTRKPSTDESIGRFPTMRRVFLAAVQMLYVYFKVLSADRLRGQYAEGRNTTREFVTAKELLILLVLYYMGGIGLDAGCEVDDVAQWDFKDLRNDNFYAINCNSREEGILIRNENHLSYYSLRLFEIVRGQNPNIRTRATYWHNTQSAQEVDNYVLASPSPLCLTPLFALRSLLSAMPMIYFYIERDDKNYRDNMDGRDEIRGDPGYGLFPFLSTLFSLNAILQAFYERIIRSPDGNKGRASLRENKITGYLNLDLSYSGLRIDRKDTADEIIVHLIGGIRKKVTPYPRNADGIILSGWRAPLTEEQSGGVLRRYRKFKPMWDRWWDQLNE